MNVIRDRIYHIGAKNDCEPQFDIDIFSRDSQPYKRVCPSVHPSIRPSVGPSIGPTRIFLVHRKCVKLSKKRPKEYQNGKEGSD